MQGIIFNALEEFVLKSSGMALWNEVIDKSALKSGGAYTSGMTYDDAEILSLAANLCDGLEVSLGQGLNLFGEFLFGFLMERGPIEVGQYENAQALLADLEVIHVDIKRIHPEAYTPFFEYTPISQQQGQLMYRSKRGLCAVAEGLIKGAANHYGQQVTLEHTQCTHKGDKDCVWVLTFS